MSPGIQESDVEEAALAWLQGAGWTVHCGADIAPGETGAERDHYGQVFLKRRSREALARLNPTLPADSLNDAFRRLTRPEGATLLDRNRAMHKMIRGRGHCRVPDRRRRHP